MRKSFYIITFILISFGAPAQNNQALLDSASTAYTAGKYEKTIELYQQVLDNGYESAGLYFNLGNAYYKSNKIPMAIANYERALNLDPKDEDIQFNLRLANTHVVDKIDVMPEFFLNSWWQNFMGILSSNQWALISMSVFVVGLILLLIFFLSQNSLARKFSFWTGVVLIIITLFTFNFSRKQKWMAEHEPEAIIMTPSVTVKSSPDESGTELFLIHEGLKVKVTDELGNWREIKLSDGNKGWVKEGDLEVI